MLLDGQTKDDGPEDTAGVFQELDWGFLDEMDQNLGCYREVLDDFGVPSMPESSANSPCGQSVNNAEIDPVVSPSH